MKKLISICLGLALSSTAFAQKTIKAYTEGTSREKIMKAIAMPPGCQPMTAKGYGDGHGKNPLLFSKSQLPDTVALVTVYIYDIGSTTTSRGGHWLYTENTFVSAAGGNYLANEILKASLDDLRERFRQQGVVLLTPDQYLNTPEKKKYYHDEFKPQVSGVGSFLSTLENQRNDMTVAADGYRPFDIGAANDYLRAESMGSDLARRLGVNGVLSIAIELQSNKRDVAMNGVRMVLHGPNPIPKEDKKYIGQKLGTGYYAGQIYASGTFYFGKGIQIASYKKKEGMLPPEVEGLGIIFGAFVDRFYQEMNECIGTAAKKYGRGS